MDEATQIEAHIEETRQELNAEIEELEQKLKSAVDWRHYFREHTLTMIGAAFCTGLMFGVMTRLK